MGWFEHCHCWVEYDIHEVGEESKVQSVIRYEACRCGEVRTVEYGPGKAPVVRYGDNTVDS